MHVKHAQLNPGGMPPPPTSIALLVSNVYFRNILKMTSNTKETIEEKLFQAFDLVVTSNPVWINFNLDRSTIRHSNAPVHGEDGRKMGLEFLNLNV